MKRENLLLTPENVTLTTATVAVSTMTFNRKQVTLSVFRQLPVLRPTLIPTLALWGTVRYPIKGEGKHWVVGVGEGRLYRACIDPRIARCDTDSVLAANDLKHGMGRVQLTLRYGGDFASLVSTIVEESTLDRKDDFDAVDEFIASGALDRLPQLFIAV